ncbi:MAG: amino acid permease, partial [Ktedonobacteraceae bacterium]|nr:amino acid permease [Ktedonobacteraceae bacterium]
LSGFDMVAAAGEEVEKPQRTLPLAILLTLAIVLLLYLLVTAATAGVLSPPELVSGTSSPLADAAGQLFGRTGQQLIAGAAMLTTAATGNAVLLATSRITFAMGRDRLLPRVFAHVHPSTKIPWVAIPTSGVMLALLALTGTVLADAIPLLASVGSFLYVLQFVFPLAALVVLRRRSSMTPSFRTPAPYLVLPLAFGVCLLLLYESRHAAIGIGLGWLTAGLLAYLVAQSLMLYVRRKRYMEKGYIATMEEIVALKDQISRMLNEPQAAFEQLLATRERIAELKRLRAMQARIEELEQHRTAQGRIQELKDLRTTQAGIEELELLQAMQARIEDIKLLRATQARTEESNFLRTIQVQPRWQGRSSVFETDLHRGLGELDVPQEATASIKTDEPDPDITIKRKVIN